MTAEMGGVPPRKHPHAASRVYEGEAFIVLPESGQYKILNAVGSRVWELIDGTRTVDEIAGLIADEYEVTLESARSDVVEFLGDLKENGMLAGDGAGKED